MPVYWTDDKRDNEKGPNGGTLNRRDDQGGRPDSTTGDKSSTTHLGGENVPRKITPRTGN